MSDRNSTQSVDSAAARKQKQFWAKVVGIIIVVAIAVLKPRVEAWLDGKPDNSPEQRTADSTGRAIDGFGESELGTLIISEPDESQSSPPDSDLVALATGDSSSQTQSGSKNSSSKSVPSSSANSKTRAGKSGSSTSKPGTSTKASGQDKRSNPDRSDATTGSSSSGTKSKQPPPGKLTLVRGTRDEFRSTAGLMYVPGSQDGHRLKHVLKHAKDNKGKPVHGVFKGDRDQILAWIDRAYVKGKKGGKGTKKENQGGRIVYTVDLGEKIGFVGGHVGERKRNPPCRFLRLVIQNDNEVVTAYPSESL